MAYQALYRRYRSQRFGDLRGQPHVVNALRNAVRDGRVSHAYLFSGPRGTGKTSTARIMAKALNCEDVTDGEPCGVCESCVAIEHGTSYDLQELDAASNNGVDAMRDLIAKAALGSPGRTKVYILDEVHMLSTAASNALLKTLEEPPPHVVFVLATTDPEKVLRTIRSRTQHLEFHLLPADELAEHVRWVAADAGLDIDDSIVDFVLRKGAGSARDALSALDQVVAAGGMDDDAAGADELIDAICRADTGGALAAVDGAVKVGRDPRVLGEALLARLRDVFLQRMGATLDHLPEADLTRVAGWAEQLSDRTVTRALEAVGEALLEMRQAPDARIPLEVALVRITRADVDSDLGAVVARLERLERAIEAGDTGPAPARTSGTVRSRPGDAARAAISQPSPSAVGASPPPPSLKASANAAPPPSLKASANAAPPPSLKASANAALPPQKPNVVPSAPDPSATTATPAAADPAAPEPPSVRTTNELPTHDALTMAWGDTVLPGLRGLAKAMYAVGRFLETEAHHAVFALPNEPHRAKCAEKQADVEAALATHFGQPVPLRLVVDPGMPVPDAPATPAGTGDHERSSAPSSRPNSSTNTPEEDDLDIDVSDLTDAPADARTPLDRVQEIFPGASLVEGEQ